MNWRDQILEAFPPQIARLTLVADPNSLVSEEVILQVLQERGYSVLFFENSISFRYAYETSYRTCWDRSESANLVVITSVDKVELRTLPFDVWQTGRQLSFSLIDLFPNLNISVVRAMDRSDLDALYEAQVKYSPEQLGYRATCDFVLRYVFEIDPDFIKQDSDLLRVLLRRHYQKQRIPDLLDQRLIQILRQYQKFTDWPLEKVVSNREEFFSFLQERWPIFLEHQVTGKVIRDTQEAYLSHSGPPLLPFDHHDVWVFIDNLFLEGMLRPISYAKANLLSKPTLKVGVRLSAKADHLYRLTRLLKRVDEALPAPEAKHQDWLTFAYPWAELIVLWQQAKSAASSEQKQQFQALQQKVDQRFFDWVQLRYGGLYNQPALTPVMVHHIPRTLARYLETFKETHTDHKAKEALLVMDGLALDQWLILRDVLMQQRSNLKFQEEAAFGWLPSLTPVSRQAIFAGKLPIYYPDTISRTDKEANYWEQFWVNQGLSTTAIAYAKGLRDEKDIIKVEQILSHPKLQVVGLVIDKVDKIMHGMELGTAGMHNQVRQWAGEHTFIIKLLDLLLDRGFGILLTADHGNIEAVGCGSPAEGAIADIRGERARVYPDQSLRATVKEKFPSAIEWPPLGLPENYYPLLAPNRLAFVQEGKMIVGHGGISVEEVIVPLIKIERSDG
jgi:hypothetical protein